MGIFHGYKSVHTLDWNINLDRSSIFYRNIENIHLETGQYRVIKTVELKTLKQQINSIKNEMNDFDAMCNGDCPSSGPNDINIDNEMLKLDNELDVIYGILGGQRNRRGVNFIGSGMKYLFGTMDNNDSEYITEVLQSVGNRQDKLHTIINGTVVIMKNLTKQWEFMRENQNIQIENFRSLKEIVKSQYLNEEKIQWELDYNTISNHIENLLLSIQIQIDKLKTAILFLKSGIVDPYLVDTKDLFSSLIEELINYKITYNDLDNLNFQQKPIAIFDELNDAIHIIFSFPIVNKDSFNLYESFPIPKHFEDKIIIVDDVPKYFGISKDNSSYITDNLIPCLKISSGYICKNMYTFSVDKVPSCASDVYLKQDDNNCKYKSLKQSIDVYNIVDFGILMFSSFGVNVELKCSNNTDTINLKGSYLLVPPKNCILTSALFKFYNNSQVSNTTLKHFVPVISCCSKFFKISNVSTFDDHVLLNSFHEIRKINADSVTKLISEWTIFNKVDFKGHIKTWHLTTMSLVIIIFVVLVIYIKCSGFFCKKANKVIVNYTPEPPRNLTLNGYPSFL